MSILFTGEIYRLVIFVALAAVRTLLELLLWKLLVVFGEKSELVEKILSKIRLNIYAFSHGVSFVASVIASYFLNRYITFSDTHQLNSTDLILKFSVVSLFTLVLSVWLMNFLTSNKYFLDFSKTIEIVNKHWPLLAKIITIAVTMLINYFGYRWFVFLV